MSDVQLRQSLRSLLLTTTAAFGLLACGDDSSSGSGDTDTDGTTTDGTTTDGTAGTGGSGTDTDSATGSSGGTSDGSSTGRTSGLTPPEVVDIAPADGSTDIHSPVLTATRKLYPAAWSQPDATDPRDPTVTRIWAIEGL